MKEKKIFKKGLIFSLIFVFLVFGIWFFYSFFHLKIPKIKITLPQITETIKPPKFSLPPPLQKIEKEKPEVILTQEGVIEWTNREREKHGLLPLKESQKLNEIALLKVKDMFNNQYFSHYSPSGEGVGELAQNFGYEFLLIGENLAMGNFESDEDLVKSWMESPGHRENILNPHYQEIGVAVKKGVFEGKTVWLAVQHFGLPLSVCPQPDLALKAKIEENQEQIFTLQKQLSLLKSEIEKIKPKRDLQYYQKIEKYNELVSQYNSLVNEQEALINQYNLQVNLFNQCLEKFTK
jgi:uncharacterized protein YkwD